MSVEQMRAWLREQAYYGDGDGYDDFLLRFNPQLEAFEAAIRDETRSELEETYNDLERSVDNTQRWKERAEIALEQLEASERRATQWGKENVRLQDELQRAKEMLTEAERQRHFWSRESLRHENQLVALQAALQSKEADAAYAYEQGHADGVDAAERALSTPGATDAD